MKKSAVTRLHILAEAASALRKDGPERTSVAAIMGRLGLTHGGFYSHFSSKDDLAAQAITFGFDELSAEMVKATEGKTPHDALVAAIDRYVSIENRDCVEHACPLTTLVNDAPRMSQRARERFAEGSERFPDRIERLLRQLGVEDARGKALSAVAEMVGANVIARATLDRARADEILQACRQSVKSRLGLTVATGECETDAQLRWSSDRPN